MIRAIYPGSFDPVTLGHMDIIKRSQEKVDELIIAVLDNTKKSPMFSVDERVSMLQSLVGSKAHVRVEAFSGLLADFVRQKNANVIIRGLRAISDFDYELQMAQTNRVINPEADTMFLATSLEYAYLSSTTVKEVALFEGNIEKFVPASIIEAVHTRITEIKKTKEQGYEQ